MPLLACRNWPIKSTLQGNKKLFHAKMKVNSCSVGDIGLSRSTEEEEDGEIEVLAIFLL